MKYLWLLCCLLSGLHAEVQQPAEEFIVKQKGSVVAPEGYGAMPRRSDSKDGQASPKQKLSRSKLKEELGSVAKELFSEATALVKRIGTYLQLLGTKQQPTSALQTVGCVHHHVAYVQTTCGQLAEALLDDEPHVAKATKIALNDSLQTMRDAVVVAKQFRFDNDKQEATKLQGHEQALRDVVDRMKNDACLRHV